MAANRSRVWANICNMGSSAQVVDAGRWPYVTAKPWSATLYLFLLLLLFSLPVQAKMVTGVVVYVDGKFIAIATDDGVTVGELYGGYYSLNPNDA